MSDVAIATCKSCGAPQEGVFCDRCGEKRTSAHDYSVAHFLEHALETFTHFDYRSLRAVRVLCLEPGRLTREYLDGRRKPYVGPLQLFVILNVVFALVGGQTFRVPLEVADNATFASTKKALVADARAHHAMSAEEFEKEFDRTGTVQAKSWVFTMIPVYALVLAVLYGFRRYFFSHLIFATHFMAFLLIWLVVAGIPAGLALRLYQRFEGVRLSPQTFGSIVSVVILVGVPVYVYLALRRAYGDGKIAAGLRAVAMTGLFIPILTAYRFLLFFVTLKLMH